MGPDLRTDHLGHESQDGVSGTVPDLVVDLLEVVEVDHERSERVPGGPLRQGPPISHARERIAAHISAQLGVGQYRVAHGQNSPHRRSERTTQGIDHPPDVGVFDHVGRFRGES